MPSVFDDSAALGLVDGFGSDDSLFEDSLLLGVSCFRAGTGDFWLVAALLVEDLGEFLSSPLLDLGDFSLGFDEVFDDVVSTSYTKYLSYFFLSEWCASLHPLLYQVKY